MSRVGYKPISVPDGVKIDIGSEQLVVTGSKGEMTSPVPAGISFEIEGAELVTDGRCDHPGQSCGCQTEEFGSGFVEPSSCRDCAIHQLKREGRPNFGCEGCNRYKLIQDLVGQNRVADMESLVQQITDQIVERFEA